eukprot:s374_g1.t1
MLAAAELLPDEGTLRPYFVGLQMFKLVVWRSKVQGSWDMETPPDLRVQAVKDAAPKAPSASAPPSLCAGGAVDTCEVLLQAAPQNDARSDSSPSMEHNAGALRTGQVRSGARGGRVRPGPVVQDADDSERANRGMVVSISANIDCNHDLNSYSYGNPMRIYSVAEGRVILDRTSLILRIFAQRARTKEAKLQVKLASQRYMLPRLRYYLTTGAGMEAQGGSVGAGGTASGGGAYLKGKGETQLSLDSLPSGLQNPALQGHATCRHSTKSRRSCQESRSPL